jgi:hypothetical protein
MKQTSKIEDEVDAIRDKIYEEIKGMSAAEEIAYINTKADAVCKEFGIWQQATEAVEETSSVTSGSL